MLSLLEGFHRRTFVVLALCIVLAGAGCASIATSIAKNLAKRDVERTLSIPRGDFQQYKNCFETRGGDCFDESKTLGRLELNAQRITALAAPGGKPQTVGEKRMALVSAVLADPVHLELVHLYNGLLHEDGKNDLRIDIKESEFNKYLDKVEDASLADGWCEVSSKLDEDDGQSAYFNTICAYYRTYFRNGRFAQLKIDQTTILEELKKKFPGLTENEIKKIFKYLFGTDDFVFGEIGETGFVTRAGALYRFPAFSVKVDPLSDEPVAASEVDFKKVGADLVRVFWEAVFDAHDGLPGVSNATGVNLALDPLDEHDPTRVTREGGVTVSAEEFGTVERMANQTEGWSSAALGRLIRGAGPVALNNEALATLLETIVGSIVRKVTEKAAWCVFSCGICNIEEDGTPSCPALFSKGETVDITVAVRLGR
jgi:hypothetical protein